jgi:hypothetical protein
MAADLRSGLVLMAMAARHQVVQLFSPTLCIDRPFRDIVRLTEWLGCTFVVRVILGAALQVWSSAWTAPLLSNRWTEETLSFKNQVGIAPSDIYHNRNSNSMMCL